MSRSSSNGPLAFHGTFIHSLSVRDIEVVTNGLLVVDQDGKIALLKKSVEEASIGTILADNSLSKVPVKKFKRGQFLVPGFIDTHNHAPQWAQRGTGRGRVIMDWLNQITFPHEAKFENVEYAKKTYALAVEGFLKQGVTTASYYGSLHGPATKVLADVCLAKGQRALVGKCNMNREAPDYYVDTSAEESLEVTEDFIAYCRKIDPKGDLVKAILTPRFAISCTADLLSGLGKIAANNPDLPIQTHFDEAEQEMEITKKLYPEFDSEADLYEHFGLMNGRTIMAHCIYVGEYESKRIKATDCGVSHCPVSNMTGGGFGVAPIREFLRRGIKVGLGTDSGGGYSSSILDAMREAFALSNAKMVETGGKDPRLSIKECFFLATLGGAQVCCLDDEIGNFIVGKAFDALEINTVDEPYAGVITMVEDEDDLETVFEKFIMSGDDRNIAKVYVNGRLVKG